MLRYLRVLGLVSAPRFFSFFFHPHILGAAAVDGSLGSAGLTGRLSGCVFAKDRNKEREICGYHHLRLRPLLMPPSFKLRQSSTDPLTPSISPILSPLSVSCHGFTEVFRSSSSLEAGEAGLWPWDCRYKSLVWWQGKHGSGMWMRKNIICWRNTRGNISKRC